MKKVLSILMVVAIICAMSAAAFAEVPEGFKLGLCNINEKGVFGKQVKLSFQQACDARGWELVYADNNADGQTAVANADTMALREVDFVVDLNTDKAVGQTIMDIFNKAEIPALAVDIALPGAPFFGIDSGKLGYFNGESAAKYIQDNFDGEVDEIVLITQIKSGDEVQKRCRSAVEALDAAGIKYKNVVEIEGENDAAIVQQRFTDFLTAHPVSEKIIVFTINTNAGAGVYAAACTADREWDCRIFSVNVDNQFIEPMYEKEGDMSWVCSISNYTEFYGEQVCQLVEEYFNNGSIPDNTCCKFGAITWENVKEEYPKDNLPWKDLV